MELREKTICINCIYWSTADLDSKSMATCCLCGNKKYMLNRCDEFKPIIEIFGRSKEVVNYIIGFARDDRDD